METLATSLRNPLCRSCSGPRRSLESIDPLSFLSNQPVPGTLKGEFGALAILEQPRIRAFDLPLSASLFVRAPPTWACLNGKLTGHR